VKATFGCIRFGLFAFKLGAALLAILRLLGRHANDGQQSVLVVVTRRQHNRVIQELVDGINDVIFVLRSVCNFDETLNDKRRNKIE
jgi:hypothetical protein